MLNPGYEMSGHDYIIIGSALIVAVLISLLVTPAVMKLAKKVGVIDTPKDGRRMHDHPIPMLGGLSIIIAFFVTAIAMSFLIRGFNSNSLSLQYLRQLLPGALIIAVMGFFDDKYNLPALPRLLIQCLAAGITVAMGVQITFFSGSVSLFKAQTFGLGMFSIPITVLWIVGMTNAVNWIDGLDGLASGISSIAAFSILLIAVFQPGAQHLSIAILAAALCGGCLGFLHFNKNPAKIFMGDTGSMFLGFTLSVISIQGYIKIYTTVSFLVPLLILGLPLLDTTSAVIRRICKGVSPTTADRSHIHHKLVDLGLSQKQAVILLYTASGALSIVAVLFSIYSTAVGWRFLLIGFLVVMLIFLALLKIFRRKNARIAMDAAAASAESSPARNAAFGTDSGAGKKQSKP